MALYALPTQRQLSGCRPFGKQASITILPCSLLIGSKTCKRLLQHQQTKVAGAGLVGYLDLKPML